MWFITHCVLLSLGAQTAQQENIPPATSSGPQQSNPMCTLSNPSLMSSAPNILQPLTLNSSNGLLETIFPVDHTPSPESPHGDNGQENASGDTGHCRQRLALQTRPFSELYSEEFVPLDSDITSPETPQNSHEANDESSPTGNEIANENNLGDSRTQSSLANSVDVESPDETTDQVQGTQDVIDDTDGANTTSPQQSCENNQSLESQPTCMEIPDESDDVNDSGFVTQMPLISDELEMTLPGAGQRNSVGSLGSIELTEDSPLRILEERERVLEEIALSNENLLQDPSVESDDELEQMDVTDETIAAEPDSSLNSDYSMEDVLGSETSTAESVLNDSNSLETQALADRGTELPDAATSSLLDEDEDDNILSSLQEHECSRSSPPAVECLPGPSVVTALIETETQPEEVTVSEGSLELHSDHEYVTVDPQSAGESSEQQAVSEQNQVQQDVPMSLLEYVDHIVGNEMVGETTAQSNDSEMVVESVGDNMREGALSTASGVRASEASLDSESGVAISSVTLPVVASEPVCLDATSLQSASTSEMLVDTPGTVTVDNRMTNDNCATPQRPVRSKRLSRSSSDPRSTHAKRRGERARNEPRGANHGDNSPRLSRPPFVRRVTEPPTVQTSDMNSEVVNVTIGSSVPVSSSQEAEQSNTSAVTNTVAEPVSPRESVVMAVPLSPPPQRATPSGLLASAVVVADGVAETEAVVTPLPSPEFNSEGISGALDTLSTAVGVPVISELSRRDGNESLTTRDLSNDYVLVIPAESRQPSSAPSTLQRDAVPANATVSTNRTQDPRRRGLSHDTPSSVIYATPVSGVNRDLADRYSGSSSFPRQSSTTRVTPLSGSRRRSSSSGGTSSTQTRAASERSQSLPRNSSHVVSVSTSPVSVPNGNARQDSQQPRSHTTERINNDSSLGASSLPGPSNSSNSDLNQSREAIQSLLRSYCVKTSQAPKGSSSAGQPTTSSTPAQEPGTARRVPNHRTGNRQSSGQRQQGRPVHLSIQDQQQAREGQPSQQPAEEEPLPSSKKWVSLLVSLLRFDGVNF